MKTILIGFALAILVSYSTQASNELFISKCESGIDFDTCCVQSAQILALTSAVADAYASAFAAVEVVTSVGTAAAISASVTAATAAEASFTQALAISFNTGTCCQIDTAVYASAQAAASASATASAEAIAVAAATANASAAAVAAAYSASTLLAQANALVSSSCCSFVAELTSSLQILGGLVAKAQTAAEAAVSINSQVQVIARASASTSASAFVSARALASNSIDNCCSNSRIRVQANATASVSVALVDHVNRYVGLVQGAFSSIKVIAQDVDSISNFAVLSDRICANECRNVESSCCSNYGSCKARRPRNVCDIGVEIVTAGFLSAAAKAKAVVAVNTYVETGVKALAKAVAQTRICALAAVFVSSAVTVTVRDCCAITIVVDNSAKTRASAFASAYAAAKAAALAYSEAVASAGALAKASSEAYAFALAAATFLNDASSCGLRCCNFRRYPFTRNCCEIDSIVVASFSYAGAKACDVAVAWAYQYAQSGVKSVGSVSASTISNVISSSRTQSAFLLQCCCCTKTTTPPIVIKQTGTFRF